MVICGSREDYVAIVASEGKCISAITICYSGYIMAHAKVSVPGRIENIVAADLIETVIPGRGDGARHAGYLCGNRNCGQEYQQNEYETQNELP